MCFNKILNKDKELIAVLVGSTENKEEKKEKRGYIAMIVVCQSQRGKGLGKKLVEEFEKDLQNQGYHNITLETECVNRSALALYESILKRFRILQNKIVQKLLPKRK